MTISKFELAKTKRYFYISSYRTTIKLLLISVALNFILLGLITYIHFNQPSASYYGTNGITNPVLLKSMNQPNYGAKALLEEVAADVQINTSLE
jgi:hypothetical protein